MKIKVCGMKYPENIRAVASLQPDYLGFIFYDKTPRYIGEPDRSMMAEIPATIQKTGVFVNESPEKTKALVTGYRLDAVQLHGSESPEFCAGLKAHTTVIKAFGVDGLFDFGILNEYAEAVDYFLFDTKTAIHGGSGKSFNWQLLNGYSLDVPFFISGGLSPENIEEAIQIDHPEFYGLDLNSRFETAPGLKAIDKLERAFAIIKQHTNELRS